MINNKVAGRYRAESQMLKASREAGPAWVAHMCNAVVEDGKIAEGRSKRWLASVYKGKGDALECGL